MRKLKFLTTLFLFFTGYSFVYAQVKNGYISVGAGYNILSFKGDLGKEQQLYKNTLNSYRRGFNFHLEKRFGKTFGIGANALFGKISQNELSNTRIMNFESKIHQFELTGLIHLDNDLIMPRKSDFAPFFSAGIGYLMFDPYTDIKDKNGKTYYYWENGIIKDQPNTKENKESAQEIYRDYVYETQLKDSVKNYARNALSFPITAGLKFKLHDKIQAKIYSTYYLTTTDYIDNIKNNNNNDKYLVTTISFHYTFGKVSHDNNYDDVHFYELTHEDSDNDGVNDLNDECQGTPEGVKTDNKGCPLDTDSDGVPDYLDKEPNTAAGSEVNEDGITITEEMYEENASHLKDTIIIVNTITHYDISDGKKLKELDEKIKKQREENKEKYKNHVLPERFKIADINNNGIIESDEIYNAIEGILDGSMDISSETLNELIDYFFEQ